MTTEREQILTLAEQHGIHQHPLSFSPSNLEAFYLAARRSLETEVQFLLGKLALTQSAQDELRQQLAHRTELQAESDKVIADLSEGYAKLEEEIGGLNTELRQYRNVPTHPVVLRDREIAELRQQLASAQARIAELEKEASEPDAEYWHELKTDPAVFDLVAQGKKTFEIRLDDRNFQVGDGLLLRKTRYSGAEMREGKPLEYVGVPLRKVVSHVLRGPLYGLADGWAILSLYLHAPQAIPEGWKLVPIEYVRELGEAGSRYFDNVKYGQQQLPAPFLWHQLWEQLLAAAPSPEGEKE